MFLIKTFAHVVGRYRGIYSMSIFIVIFVNKFMSRCKVFFLSKNNKVLSSHQRKKK